MRKLLATISKLVRFWPSLSCHSRDWIRPSMKMSEPFLRYCWAISACLPQTTILCHSVRNGERQKRTEWHKIVVWGKQAEIAQQYLKKGSLIFIEGRIQSREWQDKEGQKRTSFEIVATNFRMLGGRGDGGAGGGGASMGGARAEEHDQSGLSDDFGGHGGGGGTAGPEISDEDIPF